MPSLSWTSVAEQSVFGTIKDVAILRIPPTSVDAAKWRTAEDGWINLLACLSDSGHLTFVGFERNLPRDCRPLHEEASSRADEGKFGRVAEVRGGFDPRPCNMIAEAINPVLRLRRALILACSCKLRTPGWISKISVIRWPWIPCR